MKKYYLSLVFLGGFLSAQNTYVDVVTTAALKLYSDNLKKKQNETKQQQNKLKKAEEKIADYESEIAGLEEIFSKTNPTDEELKKYNQLKEELAEIMKEWEEIMGNLE